MKTYLLQFDDDDSMKKCILPYYFMKRYINILVYKCMYSYMYNSFVRV